MKFNLKDFRQKHSMFQSDMASLLGVNQSNISRAEIKGYIVLTYPQRQALYEKFGKEEVDSFVIKEGLSVHDNTNVGDGTQNNGYFEFDSFSLNIIKQQSETLSKLAEKIVEQTDRMMTLIEKLSEKL